MKHEKRDQDGGFPEKDKEKDLARIEKILKKAEKIEKFLESEKPKNKARGWRKTVECH